MIELDPNVIKLQKKQEEREARTLEELTQLGISRNYKHPAAWARKMLEIREKYRAKSRN